MRGSEVLLHVKATVDVQEHHRRQILLDWPSEAQGPLLAAWLIKVLSPPTFRAFITLERVEAF
jgi:hypothetical protein